MSTGKVDLRQEARIRALKAGFRSLSQVSRSLEISRSRLDDILTGRSRPDPKTLQALASALDWSDLSPRLEVAPPSRVTGRSRPSRADPGEPLVPAEELVRERPSGAWNRAPAARRTQEFTIRYPEDLPRGVPLWAVVVIAQARSLGRHPVPEVYELPEAWALAAAELVRELAVDLRRELERKRPGPARRG